jgi:peptidoglycan/LPS O-acetylase OafA/YrhL
VVIYLAFASYKCATVSTQTGDLSYGIYLYAFPIQQGLVQHFGKAGLNFGVLIVLSTLLTMMAALLSWRLVEERALQLKPRNLIRHSGVVPERGRLQPRPA